MKNRITGKFDVSLILPVLIGLLYAGTGGWTAERWSTALVVMGIGPVAKMNYDRGYKTYNPNLTDPARPRDSKGRFIANPDD